MLHRAVALACATLVLVSCGSDGTATDPSPTGEDTVSPSEPRAGGASPVARQAASDLARRLGVGEDEVVVESMEEVTWRDGSLGCAEKGTMYTQALVDGSRITLRFGKQTYEYHSGGSRAPFLCERPTQ